jgi:hypothetical protein
MSVDPNLATPCSSYCGEIKNEKHVSSRHFVFVWA